MFDERFTELARKEAEKGEVFASAVVVNRKAPSSGKPGDKAIINQKGEVKGWIGGGCTKGIVIKESLEAIQSEKPRLVKIEPGLAPSDQNGVKTYTMLCESGGSLDVYIEPVIPMTQIFIFGRSHIAKALSKIGQAAGFNIHVITDMAEDEMFEGARFSSLEDFDSSQANDKYVVVCTQGENDTESLKTALQSKPKYTAFVASPRKANSVFRELMDQNTTYKDLMKIKTPAGLDINAKTAEEVAISILAQIVEFKRSEKNEESQELLDEIDELYINPVCKIPVQKSSAKYVVVHKGENVYFCCDGCKDSFEKEPEAYINE